MLLSGESVKEKKTAALFVVTFIFIGYAVVIQGGTKLRHIRPRNGLQGHTCIEMLIKCRLVILI